MSLTDLQVDTTTYVLGVLLALLLVVSIYLRPPPPQAHPFLLGRQSTVSRTRFPSESPVYTSGSTGGARAALRPEKKIRTLKDVLDGSETHFDGAERGTWIQGGERLKDVVDALRAGLLSSLGGGNGTVAVLIEDPTDALLVILALALTPHKPLVISPGSSLPSTTQVTAIVQCSTLFSVASALSTTPDAKWISVGGAGDKSSVAEDLLITGRALLVNGEAAPVPAAEPTDVALTIVSEGVSLEFTHLNLTASLIAWLSLFPASPMPTRPSVKDVVQSFHHPSTPYGFGLALLTIYTSAALSLPTLLPPFTPEALQALLSSPASAPSTLIFAPSTLLGQPLYSLILQEMMGDSAFLIRWSRDGKLRLLRSGSVSKTTWWDYFLFSSLRADTRTHKLRALVLEGPLPQNRLELFRIALGVPAISTTGHGFALAPLTAGAMYDFQRLPPPGSQGLPNGKELGHVGAPVAGVEVKLVGEESPIAAGRVRGELVVRAPLLPASASFPPSILLADVNLPQLPICPGSTPEVDESGAKWLRTGINAEMGKEGVMWLE